MHMEYTYKTKVYTIVMMLFCELFLTTSEHLRASARLASGSRFARKCSGNSHGIYCHTKDKYITFVGFGVISIFIQE